MHSAQVERTGVARNKRLTQSSPTVYDSIRRPSEMLSPDPLCVPVYLWKPAVDVTLIGSNHRCWPAGVVGVDCVPAGRNRSSTGNTFPRGIGPQLSVVEAGKNS